MSSGPNQKLIANRYEIRRSLGVGGVGLVYQAWDLQLHRFVAVKRWKPPEPLAGDRADTEKLWREAMTLAAIQHPNILTIHDFGVDDEGPYVITEYVDGETLDRVIQRGPLDKDAFADAAQQVLEGLLAAHQAGMIHRDLKPQNIMRTRLPGGAWQYKILDFGLARFVTQPTVQSMEDRTSIYGSVFYIAPEQLRHEPLDARTDLYSVGCVFYFVLAGRNAFEGDSIPAVISSHLQHRVAPLQEVRPDLPPELCEWVMRLIRPKPDERFGSAGEALVALRKILSGGVRVATMRIATPSKTLKIVPVAPNLQTGPLPAPATGILTIPPARKAEAEPTPAAPRVSWRLAGVGLASFLILFALAALVFRPWEVPERPTPPAVETATEPDIGIISPAIPRERQPQLLYYYQSIRDMEGFNWGNVGAALEAVALLEYQKRYHPPDYTVLANLSYRDEAGYNSGELDLIVWNLPSNCAESVYEVKISDNYAGPLRRARSQLNRFRTAVLEDQNLRFGYPRDPTWRFEASQFKGARYGVIGGKGAVEQGCDDELDVTRLEVEWLHRRVLDHRKKRGIQP